MQVLHRIFHLLIVVGCWRPSSWTSPFKALYTLYAAFLFVVLYIATFVQFLDLILNVETQDELSDNIYLMLTMVVACQKMYGLLTSHKNIAALTDILEDEPFQPENGKEVGIREEFDKKAHQHAFFHLAVTEMSVLFYSFAGILKVDEIKLPFRMWLPCDYLPLPLHIVIYMLQVVSLVTGSMVHVACDTLIWGLLIHTCSQLEILGSRLKAIKPDDNQSARLAARYHNRVYRFAKMINEEFKMIIFVQFSVSTLVVCFTLYMLVTTKNSNDQFFKVIMYACSMLVQIFFFCWYGNEVKLKSVQISDTIFGSDWPSLSRETKRILLVIMRRATRSIEFTSVHIVTVNLDAFVNLLKTSYSAYNVLQSGQGYFAMKALRSSHILLVLCGIYLPSSSGASPLKKLFYKVYAIVPVIMMYSLFVAQSLDIAFHVTNLDEFSDNFATSSLLLVDCIKHGVLSMRRESLIELTDMLSKNLFASVTEREIKIRERYDKLVELNTNLYGACFFGCTVIAFLTTTIIDFKKRRLVVSVWLPYNYSSVTLYLLTTSYEWIAGEYAIMTSAACDCLYIGLLLHICGQIKVLEHRFQTLTEEGYYSLNQCAAHHYNIYQFAKAVNEIFTEVMFFQFAASTSIMCLNLYRVLNCESVGRLIETLLYSSGTFAQIAYYCWFSNEVKLMSIEFADEIFYSDWVSWGTEAKKVFLMVITRSAQPIEFSCISILPINLESFMNLLKTSYSAFNIMQQAR
ncbi:uncharacterized protein LOC100882009 [Megachile rotundata]|uniref:uncharacterized protein LOC100882009 n=1 Tax=Megachile rotundata TaxID=143995 RepID=UPI003FD0D851